MSTSAIRVFLKYGGSPTRAMCVSNTDTFEEWVTKCKTKFGLEDKEITICLDEPDSPVVEEMDVLQNGDRLVLRLASETVVPCENSPPVQEASEDSVVPSPKPSRKRKTIPESDSEESDDESEEESEEDSEEDSEVEDSEEDDSGSECSEYDDESQEEENDESECESDDADEKPAPKAKLPRTGATMEAKMENETAAVAAPAVDTQDGDEIRERIRNILQRGLHPTTPESEAVQAMRLAERMLRKHNLTRAQVMAATEATMQGELFKVHMRYVSSGQPCKVMGWFNTLAQAAAKLFGCKTYFVTRHAPGHSSKCYRAFYGITENAYAAALAFEHAFNRVAFMMAKHTPSSGEYDELVKSGKVVSRVAHTKQAKLSYAEGLADGIEAKVEQDIKAQMAEDAQDASVAASVSALAVVTEKTEAEVCKRYRLNITTTTSRYSRGSKGDSYHSGVVDSASINLKQNSLGA